MGNGAGKLGICCGGGSRRHDRAVVISDPLDEGLGHSFCYVRPDPCHLVSSKVHSEETTTFRSISGAYVSANTSTPLSTSFVDECSYTSLDRAAAFESSTSFASVPLQPVPRCWAGSGPLSGSLTGMSGPFERAFLSGPIERGLFSGPLENCSGGGEQFQRSFSHGDFAFGVKPRKGSLIKGIRKAIVKKISRGGQNSIAPIKGLKETNWVDGLERNDYLSCELGLDDEDSMGSQNLQWATGKAGEDRVHVVISEEHGWVFIGIYDGFNGPDAPDYLLSNLYPAVHKELKGLLWDDKSDLSTVNSTTVEDCQSESNEFDQDRTRSFEPENYPSSSGNLNLDSNSRTGRARNAKNRYKGAAKKWEESQRRWRCEWDRERLELDRKVKEQLHRASTINHSDVLKALSLALKKTEEAYLDITEMMKMENPELALMGSCVLVMLMKGDDVYVMNVGDSRAVLAQKAETDFWIGKAPQDLEQIKEETLYDLETCDGDKDEELPNSVAIQLTKDHSTSITEEVERIKKEHPDDPSALSNDRVKGSLKVTRAFGAGFLKQPKLNNALLEMFRIDYVGTSPYITCLPSLYHHRLSPKDRFLILSSDGLYQYFTNEEAVSEVELFLASSPEGDPALHLVEEVVFRAAKRAGMDFHELLEIPQGDRRRYHDDVSAIVISLEGRIWRSCL